MSIVESPTSPAFTCLYYLENDTHSILKIKRTDLPSNTDLAIKSLWFFLDRQALDIHPLILRSTDASGEIQECFFEQGYLKFNAQTGTFIEKFNSAQYQLENKTGQVLPKEIQQAVSIYLGNQ